MGCCIALLDLKVPVHIYTLSKVLCMGYSSSYILYVLQETKFLVSVMSAVGADIHESKMNRLDLTAGETVTSLTLYIVFILHHI